MELDNIAEKTQRLQGILDDVERAHFGADCEAIATALRARAQFIGVRFSGAEVDRLSDALARGQHVQLHSGG